MSNDVRYLYEFGKFRFDSESMLLNHDEKEIHLPPKALELLKVLIENRGEIIERNFLIKEVWADSFIEDSNLTVTISQLRKTFADYEEDLRFIETIPKRGYRFTKDVREIKAEKDLAINRNQKNETIIAEEIQQNRLNNEIAKPQKNTKTSRIILSSILILSLILLVGFVWKNYLLGKKDEIKSIAVLPFTSVGNAEDNKAIEFGMADTLITRLSNLKEISVRPTSTITQYTEKKANTLEAGRELGVDAVLEGTIQEVDDKVRVTIRLIKTKDGSTILATNFDEEEKDIFNVQDEISLRIAKELQLKLTEKEKRQRLGKRFTENRDAYDAYIKGRYLWSKRTPNDLEKSLEFFKKAIEIDPNYALAYTGIADSYKLFVYYRMIPVNEGITKARIAARKALEIDEELAEAHASLGYVLAFYDWNWDKAEREFKRAIELNPNYSPARHRYSEYLSVMGRFDEALVQIKKAEKQDPNSIAIQTEFAGHYFLTRQFDKAIAQSNKLIKMDSSFPIGYVLKFHIFWHQGKEEKAINSYLKTAKTYFGNSDSQIEELKNSYRNGGTKAFWQKRLEQMNKEKNQRIYTSWDYLICYLYLGDEENTFKWLEKSFEDRDRWIININHSVPFDSIRTDQRFKDIINRMGLEPK